LNFNITSAFLEQVLSVSSTTGRSGGGKPGTTNSSNNNSNNNQKRYHKIINRSGLPLKFWLDTGGGSSTNTSSNNLKDLSNNNNVTPRPLKNGEEGSLALPTDHLLTATAPTPSVGGGEDDDEENEAANSLPRSFIAISFLKRGGGTGKSFKLLRRVPVDRVGTTEYVAA